MSAAHQIFHRDLLGVGRSTKEQAPYPWIAIPPGGRSFYRPGSFPAPAYGTQIEVCAYEVPEGREGVLMDIMNLYSDAGASFIEGSGDILWDYDVNIELGNVNPSGYWLADYYHIKTALGDLQQPWPVRGGIRLKQGDIVRQKVTTVATVTVGSPAFVHGALLGWTWPMANKG